MNEQEKQQPKAFPIEWRGGMSRRCWYLCHAMLALILITAAPVIFAHIRSAAIASTQTIITCDQCGKVPEGPTCLGDDYFVVSQYRIPPEGASVCALNYPLMEDKYFCSEACISEYFRPANLDCFDRISVTPCSKGEDETKTTNTINYPEMMEGIAIIDTTDATTVGEYIPGPHTKSGKAEAAK